MTDRELIAALLGSSQLDEYELDVFQRMADWLAADENRKLSEKQRTWARDVAEKRERPRPIPTPIGRRVG